MLFDISKLRMIEKRGLDRSQQPGQPGFRGFDPSTQTDLEQKTTRRIIVLFVIVVLGILASWIWDIGWKYLKDTSQGLDVGPLLALAIRLVLSFIAAGVSFTNMYTKINQNTSESWIPYFTAFQNGFFWNAVFQSIVQSFGKS